MASASRLRTVGVVLAGGVGTRFGTDVPKQLMQLAGRPIIEHTLAVFEAAAEVDEILVVITPGHLADVTAIVAERGLRKVAAVIEGGAMRNDSTRAALDHLGVAECNVLLHDAVRPLVTASIIRDCVAALADFEAVGVGIASTDTVVVVDDSDRVVDIPPRARLRRAQTPQAFRLSTIRRAYELAGQDPGFDTTDDCGVVLKYLPDVAIRMVEGSEDNIKVTAPFDLMIAEQVLRDRGSQAG